MASLGGRRRWTVRLATHNEDTREIRQKVDRDDCGIPPPGAKILGGLPELNARHPSTRTRGAMQIAAAQLRLVTDRRLGKQTPDWVKQLAAEKLHSPHPEYKPRSSMKDQRAGPEAEGRTVCVLLHSQAHRVNFRACAPLWLCSFSLC
ncbi:hypothetical protein AB0280_16310 [Pseudarthrobacter sp902506025]|uniref:hypothetical protein n=1 Tax=Pseudarthrobacter sp. 902506025 TaxID=3155291 RepID=UPI003450629A